MDRRAQSATIGVVLLLGMTVIATGAIVVFGQDALDSTTESAELQNVEHSMTLLDSRVATVALGDSSSQTISFGSGTGSFSVDDDAGVIRIVHENFTGQSPPNGDDEVVYEQRLGAVVYESGETTIAYQAGGVWRQENGASTMISPPEFHYRQATLTLPVIRVVNDGQGAGGDVSATVSSAAESVRVFPNLTTANPEVFDCTRLSGTEYDCNEDASGPEDQVGAPYDYATNSTSGKVWEGQPYVNPLRNGTVYVEVESEYADAWADYFRSRTTGTVKEFDTNGDGSVDKAELTLETLGGVLGYFTMPAEGRSISIQGMVEDRHATRVMNVSLYADQTGNDNFNNAFWSFYHDGGSQRFEMVVHSTGKCKNNGEWDGGDLEIGYYFDDGSGTTQEWYNGSVTPQSPVATPNGDPNFKVDCSEELIHANFTASTNLTYQSADELASSGSNQVEFDWDDGYEYPSVTWDQHPTDGPTTYSLGSGSANTSRITGHYFSLLGPEFGLTTHIGSAGGSGNNPIETSGSYGTITYDQSGGRYVTFLHITENRIHIDLD